MRLMTRYGTARQMITSGAYFRHKKFSFWREKKPGVPLDFLSKNSYYLGRGLHAAFGRFGVFFLPRAAMIFIFHYERM